MITSLLNADEAEFIEAQIEMEKSMRYRLDHPKLAAFTDAFWMCWYQILYLYCTSIFSDHDIEDTSSGGPDSGYISGYCKRCGFDYQHRLY